MTSFSHDDLQGAREGGDRADAAAPSPVARWVVAGCAGMIAFYLAVFALAIAGARAGRPGYALIVVLVAVIVGAGLRAGGRRGRAFLVRMAAGALFAALAGGAVTLLMGGRLSMN